MAKAPLTDTQLVILSAASQRDDLSVDLPERLRGGAAKAVLATLLAKALIEAEPNSSDADGSSDPEHRAETSYRISSAGLSAIGVERDADEEVDRPDANESDHSTEAAAAIADLPRAAIDTSTAPAAPRAGTKLADVISLLERNEGASIDELSSVTGWLAHTTRAALTGRPAPRAQVAPSRGRGSKPPVLTLDVEHAGRPLTRARVKTRISASGLEQIAMSGSRPSGCQQSANW